MLTFGLAHLPLEWAWDPDSVYAFSWLGTVGLATTAHVREMIRFRRLELVRQERERRARWLENERMFRRRRRSRGIRAV